MKEGKRCSFQCKCGIECRNRSESIQQNHAQEISEDGNVEEDRGESECVEEEFESIEMNEAEEFELRVEVHEEY